jgi:bifunctional DNA-binding transcriptional regulator/antitoxin component of YhaV-PrlF toxin-antitoxin module
MAYRVGKKGQVVIAREIRERLGVKPGWLALQRLAGDHVEILFLPPGHRWPLKGALAGHLKASLETGEEWTQARESAWEQAAAREEVRRDSES